MISTVIAGVKLAATFAPQIMRLFSAEKAEEIKRVSSAVMSIAETVTGHDDEDRAFEVLSSDPTAALQFQQALLADKHIVAKMAYADRANARETYSKHHEATDATARHIMAYNLWVVFLLAVITGAAVWALRDDGTLCAVITGLATTIINQLLAERQQVCGFRFGTSVGSKMKKG